MRAVLEALLLVGLIVAPIMVVRAMVRHYASGRRLRRAKWHVRPRSLENGDRQVWLVRRGEPDFLWDTVKADAHGHVNEAEWDHALYSANEQGLEWNSLGKLMRAD